MMSMNSPVSIEDEDEYQEEDRNHMELHRRWSEKQSRCKIGQRNDNRQLHNHNQLLVWPRQRLLWPRLSTRLRFFEC